MSATCKPGNQPLRLSGSSIRCSKGSSKKRLDAGIKTHDALQRPRRLRRASPIHLSVYSGRDLLGFIVRRGDECEALDAHHHSLGTFQSREAAIEAICDGGAVT